MILTCPDCATSYFVDDDRVPPAGRVVKCTSCGNRWRALPEGAAEPPAAPAAPPPEPAAAQPALVDDLEFVAAPVTPRRTSERNPGPRRKGLLVGLGVLTALVAAVGAVVAMRQPIAGLVPGTAKLFAAVGLPVNSLGLVVEGVTYKAVLEAGRPALAVTGAIRNIRQEATQAPAVRMSLKDHEGAVVADYLVKTLNARVPPGGVRYFAISLPDPPANAHALEIGFDSGEKVTAKATPAADPVAPAGGHAAEPVEAKPLPANSPDALTPHEQH